MTDRPQDPATPAGATPAPRAKKKTYAGPLGGVRILVADDGPEHLRLVEMFLRRAGAIVTVVDDGAKALDAMDVAKAIGPPFDLVVLDLQMPFVDGLEAASSMRRDGNPVPMIAITASCASAAMPDCVTAGFDGLIRKPVRSAELVDNCLTLVRGEDADAA